MDEMTQLEVNTSAGIFVCANRWTINSVYYCRNLWAISI
jgi:hypothetical protein